MRKKLACLLALVMELGCLAGCDGSIQPIDTTPSVSATSPTKETETGKTEPTQSRENAFVVDEDSYWIAETYYSEDGAGAEGPQALASEDWFADLMLCADGTARFRDVRGNVCLADDSYLNLTWEKAENGHFLFYSKIRSLPVLDGVYEDGVLLVEYLGMTLVMNRIPEITAENRESLPAELVGTWLMVSAETEGYSWETMPDALSSLVFRVAAYEGPLELRADLEEMDHYGTMNDALHDQSVSILNEVLYDGCGNDNWSVRIGPESPKDENGYPTETEFYATLLDYNTLLLQRYYTMDGFQAVSYQTYWRFPEIVSWRMPEYIALEGSNWVCTEYVNSQGEDRSPPDEMKDFAITFDANQTCFLFFGENVIQGTWQLENGGVILLRDAEDAYWFGGAISAHSAETTYEVSDIFEMALYYNGGILRLKMTGYG